MSTNISLLLNESKVIERIRTSFRRLQSLICGLEICDYFSLDQPTYLFEAVADDVFTCSAQFKGSSKPFLVRAGIICNGHKVKGRVAAKERCAREVEDLLMVMVNDGRIELGIPAKWVSPILADSVLRGCKENAMPQMPLSLCKPADGMLNLQVILESSCKPQSPLGLFLRFYLS